MPVGRWFHLAMTIAGTEFTLYIDGEPVAYGMGDYGLPVLKRSTNYLGKSHWPQTIDPNFYGKMDEIYFFNRALTEEDVSALYAIATPADYTCSTCKAR